MRNQSTTELWSSQRKQKALEDLTNNKEIFTAPELKRVLGIDKSQLTQWTTEFSIPFTYIKYKSRGGSPIKTFPASCAQLFIELASLNALNRIELLRTIIELKHESGKWNTDSN